MKKILGLTVAALLVMGLVGGGTWAYFSDPETSTGNILSAGTLDLNVNSGDAPVTTLNVATAYPGDEGSGNTTLYNNGSLDAELDILFGSVSNTEATGDTEFEGGGSGELGDQATFAVYIDVDMDGAWSDGDIGLSANLSGTTGTLYTFAAPLDYQKLDEYTTEFFDDVYSGNMTSGEQDGFYILYKIPLGATNAIQGDSVDVDITFTLEQPIED